MMSLLKRLGSEEDKSDEEGYVEVIMVIANGETLLKIEENPYMMQDRPSSRVPLGCGSGSLLGSWYL
jgi:hypothetical protein